MELTEFTYRLLAALGCGFLIGLERELRQKDAGLRTNILVAIGACLFVLLSIQLAEDGRADITRVAGQVVTGIGFLGAGVILKRGPNVHGLTTAATVWCSAALGCLAAAGLYYEVAIATGLVVLVNLGLQLLIKWIGSPHSEEDE
jgi:putative Mg2+ transporter-C (MgtC) family protein